MPVGAANRRRLCGQQRFELSDANPGLARSAQPADCQKPAHRRGPCAAMSGDARGQFHADADVTTADAPRRAFVRKALGGYKITRARTESAFTSWEEARDAAAEIKYQALNRLDEMLAGFEDRFIARGGQVFWASTSQQARDYILDLARKKEVRSIVKSKAMTSEEIHLNDALGAAGYGVVESDLGEFI